MFLSTLFGVVIHNNLYLAKKCGFRFSYSWSLQHFQQWGISNADRYENRRRMSLVRRLLFALKLRESAFERQASLTFTRIVMGMIIAAILSSVTIFVVGVPIDAAVCAVMATECSLGQRIGKTHI